MLQHGLDLPYQRLIASGCDQRLIPGADGLNPYGASVLPRRAVSLGSCSCSSPSWRATDAARRAYDLLCGSSDLLSTIAQLQHSVHSTLRKSLLLSADVDIALTPSGTDLEMLAVALAAPRNGGEIVNIVVGPNEVGSGTCNAAALRHHNARLPCGGDAVVGDAVNHSLASQVTVERIDIRNSRGEFLSAYEIDAAVTDAIVNAVSRDARALVHLVAHSKTGIHAPTLELIDRLMRTMKEDVVGIVDAAQGRLAPQAYQSALDRGLMVSFTGSKFFGGPPFAGALLVPPSLAPNTTGLECLPVGFENYFCHWDLPRSWFPLQVVRDGWFNTGSLLRWIGCATEIETYFAIDRSVRKTIATAFGEAIVDCLNNLPDVKLVKSFDIRANEMMLESIEGTTTVFAFEVWDSDGIRLGKSELKKVHQRLNTESDGTMFHLGQPVMIGEDRYVLRIALGAPVVIDVATDQRWGKSLSDRIESMKQMIEQLGTQIERLGHPVGVAKTS